MQELKKKEIKVKSTTDEYEERYFIWILNKIIVFNFCQEQWFDKYSSLKVENM